MNETPETSIESRMEKLNAIVAQIRKIQSEIADHKDQIKYLKADLEDLNSQLLNLATN